MVVEIALDDSILQHAAEGNSEAARRPGELSRESEIGREQHGRSGCDRTAGGKEPLPGTQARQPPQHRNSKHQHGKQHRQRGAVGGRGKGDEQEQPDLLQPAEIRPVKDQEVQRKHAQPDENVGQQSAGEDRQSRNEREAGDDQGPLPGAGGASRHSQHKRDDPKDTCGLQNELWPEMQAFAGMEKQPEDRGTARHQVALVPAGEIAAGVVLQQRVSVPQCGSQQDHHADERCGDAGCVRGA